MNKKTLIEGGSLLTIIILFIIIIVISYKSITTGSGTFSNDINIKSNIDVELMSNVLDISDILGYPLGNTLIKYYDNGKEIKFDTKYNKLGKYDIVIKYRDKEYKSILNVTDTKSPDLVLKELVINEGEEYNIKDFITSCSDNSEEDCILSFQDKYTYKEVGTYNITIIAKDESDNQTEMTTKLTIVSSTEDINTYTDNTDITVTGIKYNSNMSTNDMVEEAIQNKDRYSSLVNEVYETTNRYRSMVNESSLTLDSQLETAAMVRAIEIAGSGKFSHDRPNGTSCFTVLSDLGISYGAAGENIAYGYKSASSVMEGWRSSSGHYQNIISSKFKKIGIGVQKINNQYYWVQIFSS